MYYFKSAIKRIMINSSNICDDYGFSQNIKFNIKNEKLKALYELADMLIFTSKKVFEHKFR